MDPINPWLDPAEVRRMAEFLIRPFEEPAILAREEAGFDSSFIGFASPKRAVSQARIVTAAMPPVPELPVSSMPSSIPVAVVEKSEPIPAPASTSSPSGFLERMQRFSDWMYREFSVSAVFLLDRAGAVIFDKNSHSHLHFLARSLSQAARRPSSTAANVHVKIGPGSTLEVIPVETIYGCLVLGVVVPEPLDAPVISSMAQALKTAASPAKPR